MAGDDRGGRFHHRLPIGAGRLGDQHLARRERREVVRIRHDADLAGGDLLADRAAGGQHRAGALQRVGLEGSGARCEATVSGRAWTM